MTKRTWMGIAGTFLALAFVAAVATTGCSKKDEGSDDPNSLCEKIYKEREGMGPIWEDAPKHKDKMMEYCVSLPVEYLKCDASGSFAGNCKELIEKYQHNINDLLIMGEMQETEE